MRQMTFLTAIFCCTVTLAAERPRLAVLTDIGGDPDDQQSMIRLMVYANEFDIELLLASSSGSLRKINPPVTRPDLIHQIIDAYEQVLPNLRRHANHWPKPEKLRAVVKSGNPQRGTKYIGAGHDTEGSQALIMRIDTGSPERLLNIAIWGGQTDLAQALWRVRRDRSPAEFVQFINRMRVFDIGDQDEIADWLREKFPGMNYILSRPRPGRDQREAIFRGMYLTGDLSFTSRAWVTANVLSKGPLGALYPAQTHTIPNPHGCLKEGDTPSWFFFLPMGGNDPLDPSTPGWGGQYEQAEDGWYYDIIPTDGRDPRVTISQFRRVFQDDFARRMAWCQD